MSLEHDDIQSAYAVAKQHLLDQCVSLNGQPAHWYGELSTSALSTATAVMALWIVRKAGRLASDFQIEADFDDIIQRGLSWLADHQNDDGGWGDTTKSISNISTTMLGHAVLHAVGAAPDLPQSEISDLRSLIGRPVVIARAKAYIDRVGGIAAVRKRYGKDKTFSVPILTHCALAGLVDWSEVSSLPFELSCLPAKFYKAVKLPVVSYALPALIAIGQVRFHHRPTWNPVTRLLRKLAIGPSLKVLERIQPPHGGFLEATPLTSFVTMSLAGKGLVDHPVVQRGVRFLVDSMRPDGSWPIDTNLATWVTTLAINALGDDVPEALRPGLRDWLLRQQYREVHPYTNADPGGWAWTDLPGGVPDADDTPGAMLALLSLTGGNARGVDTAVSTAVADGVRWLRGLQNRDDGFPTFCRGWGTLPFDRSSPDITAHCIRALVKTIAPGSLPPVGEESDFLLRSAGAMQAEWGAMIEGDLPSSARIDWSPMKAIHGILDGFRFLRLHQRADGSWLPLWFGSQHAPNDENPTYGTARVLMAYRDCGRLDVPEAVKAAAFLFNIQNADGGWGGAAGMVSTVEETSLAAEALLAFETYRNSAFLGIRWLRARVSDGSVSEPSPIGFYFAKLWYFERLYPLVFAVSALRRALEISALDAET